MSVDSGTSPEERRAVCKKCHHLLTKQFINYNWVIGMCPNPDCFFNTHSQEEEEEQSWPSFRVKAEVTEPVD